MEPIRIAMAQDFAIPQYEAEAPGELIAALRRHIAHIEKSLPRFGRESSRAQTWKIGIPTVDAHLPVGGLAAHALHDIAPADYGDMPAAMGFAAAMALRRLTAERHDRRPLLWCRLERDVREYGRLYGHGLESLGLPRHRLVTVTLKRPMDVLWTAEEALKSGALAAVIADADSRHADLTQTRRLSLTAAAGKSAALLVFAAVPPAAAASHTRWRIASALSRPPPEDALSPGLPAWIIELTRARGGRPGAWHVEWNHAAHRFGLVSGISGGMLHPWAEEDRPRLDQGGRAVRAG